MKIKELAKRQQEMRASWSRRKKTKMIKPKICSHGGGTRLKIPWEVEDEGVLERTPLCEACSVAPRNLLELCFGLRRKLSAGEGAELHRLLLLLRPWLSGESDLSTVLDPEVPKISDDELEALMGGR
jgi:hypothetical protein